MEILTRRLLWRNPCAIARLPLVGRLHRAAYSPSARMRHELAKLPLRPLFSLAYRLGLGGRGSLSLSVKGAPRTLDFDGRNLQFTSLYMPQHLQGYEPDTFALLDALVTGDVVFYDVGCNWGYYALTLAARPGYKGAVHAFEPAAGSFRDLKDLVERTGLSAQIACHHMALSDRTGEGRMVAPDRLHSGLAMVTADPAGLPIALKKMDDLGVATPGVIKMDVEDHEAQVLDGGRQTLSRAKPHIVFESSIDRAVEIKMQPFERLAELGYVFFHPAWQVGPARFAATTELKEGRPAVLALVPFEPSQRFLLKPLLNVLACHRDRLADLAASFRSP